MIENKIIFKCLFFYVAFFLIAKNLGIKMFFIYECLKILTEETKIREIAKKSQMAKKTK